MAMVTWKTIALTQQLFPVENKIVVEDRYGIAVVDMHTEAIVYRWEYEMDSLYKNYMGTFSGINCLAYKGTTYIGWGASKRGGIKVMIATWDGQKISITSAIDLAAKVPASNALANEVIFLVEQHMPYLYTTLNGNNEVRKYNDYPLFGTINAEHQIMIKKG